MLCVFNVSFSFSLFLSTVSNYVSFKSVKKNHSLLGIRSFTDISGLRTFRSLWGVPECPQGFFSFRSLWGVPECPQGFFSKFFFRFHENYFPEFLHLIDLFNENLCVYTFSKQLNFLRTFRSADIPVPYIR